VSVAAIQPPQGSLVRDVEENHPLDAATELGQGCVKATGLLEGTRVSVEEEAAGAGIAEQPLKHQSADDRIRNELAPVHQLAGLLPQLAPPHDLVMQQLACGDVGNAVALGENTRLRPLSRARRPHEDEVEAGVAHPRLPRMRPRRMNPS